MIGSLIPLAYADLDWGLCPRERLEHLLATNGVNFVREREVWSELLSRARASDVESEIAGSSGVHSVLPPEGVSWTRWAEWLDRRLNEVAADPSSTVDLPPHLPAWRSYTAEVEAEAEAEAVVRRALAGVMLPVTPTVRDFVVVDAGETVGTVLRADDDSTEPRPTASRFLGVVLERTDRLRVVRVNVVDTRRDERSSRWISRWPVLTAVLGGWFSDAALGAGDPWFQQATMLASESDAVLAELVREGRELLLLSDADLHAFAASSGSCIQPPHLRWWFEWMFWRIETFDWKRPS
ncbi:hypothetical protein AB2L28_16275 [Kineococcus sp. TBRC 1896]|uniref:SUKH-4 immunity protein of toxin-antitoxin system n=1 Tax=Kineococcus mangrovi TaxID=1660183 RepID=A0ABV4I948_9ACTN